MKVWTTLTICSLMAVIRLAGSSPDYGSLGGPDTKYANPCAKKRHEMQAKSPGTFIPTCTDSGYYTYKQCHSKIGYCWCVFPKTGEDLNGTRVRPSSKKSLTCPKCLVEQAEALPPAGFAGAFVPECDGKGEYTKKQRHGSTGHSWCVDTKTGARIEGTDVGPGPNKPPQPCD